MRVRLVRPTPRWERAFLEGARRCASPFAAPPATPAAYRRYAARARSPRHAPRLVVLAGEDHLVGMTSLSEIVRGPFESCFLGYCGFPPLLGQGLMREGVALLVDHAFRDLGLHRVEANISPDNGASRALALGLGFVNEGRSRRYLKINGRWRDHDHWVALREEWPGLDALECRS